MPNLVVITFDNVDEAARVHEALEAEEHDHAISLDDTAVVVKELDGAVRVDNEVDRYIVWPGQALSYKIGQIEMWKLRREVEARQGDAFDVRAFHDAVLAAGALPLPILRTRLETLLSK